MTEQEQVVIKCRGMVQRIMYPKNVRTTNPGDFAIVSIKPIELLEGPQYKVHESYNTFSIKGNLIKLSIGDEVIMTLTNEEVNKFGVSYEVQNIGFEFDRTNKKEVLNFLKQIIGNQIAERLVEYFEDPIKAIENRNSEDLLKVKGIGEATLEKLYKSIDDNRDYASAYGILCPLGISKNLIKKVAEQLTGPDAAIDLFLNNPYRLCSLIKGIGFKMADEIAIKVNPELLYSDYRLEAAVLHFLETAGESGKTYLTWQQLYNELRQIMNWSTDKIVKVIQNFISNNTIYLSPQGDKFALMYYVELEQNIAEELLRIRDASLSIDKPENWKEVVKAIEFGQGWEYTDEQMDGIEALLDNNLVVITGYGGTGKTTVTNAVCQILNKYAIKQCALAAKAAQRIQEVTGLDASTIHRLLGNDEEYYADILIVDECSMINGELFLKLLRATQDGTKVILLGDIGQLQAIGSCNVFADILASQKIKHVKLTKIHRQAAKSAIITKSIDIRHQKMPYEKGFSGHKVLGELQDLELFISQSNEELQQIVLQEFLKDYEELNKNVLELQIITPMKSRGKLCTKELNNLIQSHIVKPFGNTYDRKDFKIYVGDKVINTKNNYNSLTVTGEVCPVFNGNIGIVKAITEDSIIVNFPAIGELELKNDERDFLNLAYAITIHSSQGSQWKRVISCMDSSAYIMLTTELLYTAITRAEKHCKLIAEDKAVRKAVKTIEQNKKQTLLSDFIINICK